MAEGAPLSHEETVRVRELLNNFYSQRSDESLHQIFQLCDRNQDGKLSHVELKSILNAVLDDIVRDDEVEAMMRRADTNQDGFIDANEFVEAMKRTSSI